METHQVIGKLTQQKAEFWIRTRSQIAILKRGPPQLLKPPKRPIGFLAEEDKVPYHANMKRKATLHRNKDRSLFVCSNREKIFRRYGHVSYFRLKNVDIELKKS